MMFRIFICLLWLIALLGEAVGKKVNFPDWLETRIIEGADYESFPDDTSALILLDERIDKIDERGARRSLIRRVVHIRSTEERSRGQVSIYVPNSAASLKQFSAWMLYPSGKRERFTTRDLVTVAGDLDELYSESSFRVLERSGSVLPETVFAYEYEVVRRSSILESYHFFQDTIPVLESKYELIVPKGWRSNVIPLNCEEQEIVSDESNAVWLGTNLKAVKDEAASPPLFDVRAMLGISVYSDKNEGRKNEFEVFDSWNAVASYLAQSQEAGMRLNTPLRQKARDLTKNEKSDWDKMRAICEFVQSVNYVAVSMNLAKGGGYTPRPAAFVLEKHYGDCKDMTVLARTMLEEIGFRSFAVAARIGNEEYVHASWPSPAQFNHCIVAIEAPESAFGSSIVELSEDRRLLFFDPTAKFTPFGELPSSLQNTLVLVGEEKTETLLGLPENTPLENQEKREVSMEVSLDGTIHGRIVETSRGVNADYMRALARQLSQEEFRKRLRDWVAIGTGEAKVNNVEFVDDIENNRFRLELDFEASNHARVLGDSKLIVRPIFLARREWVPPRNGDRTTDFLLKPWNLEEKITLRLPDGFEVESMRESVSLQFEGYSFSLSIYEEDGSLNVTRRHESHAARIGRENYPQLVDFFEQMVRSESAPIVVGAGDG